MSDRSHLARGLRSGAMGRPDAGAVAALAALVLALAPAGARALPMAQGLRPPPVNGEAATPSALQDVGIEEKLDAQVPLGARFVRQDGQDVRLGDLLRGGRPVLLALVYYECPMLCGLVLTGAARGMRETGLGLGKDFDALTVSFDPRDSPKLAAERQRGYLQAFGQPEARAAWSFLVGEDADVRALAGAVGFKYAWDEGTRQYAHPAALVVLTPDGRVSRYLYGIDYPARDLRLALVEAGQGRVGTSVDRILLTCYRYDPATRRYEPYALGFVRVAMFGVLGGVAVMLGVLWRRELRGRGGRGGRREGPDPGPEAHGAGARAADARAPEERHR